MWLRNWKLEKSEKKVKIIDLKKDNFKLWTSVDPFILLYLKSSEGELPGGQMNMVSIF